MNGKVQIRHELRGIEPELRRLNNRLVKDNTPENGKRVTTFVALQGGLPGWIVRPDRTAVENLMVEQRPLSNVGDPLK